MCSGCDNYFRVKGFWSHPVTGAPNNQVSTSVAAITFSTCDAGLLLWAQCEKALNGTDENSALHTMTLVDGGIRVMAIPLPAENSQEKVETI